MTSVVGHQSGYCSGHLVAPVAGWRQDGAEPIGEARAGFGQVRLRTIDTPWSGFGSNDPADYIGSEGQTIKAIMTLLGVGGAYGMAAGSQTFKHLYEVKLSKVDLQNHVAYRPGRKDWVPSLPEADPWEAKLIGRFIAEGDLPEQLTVKNLCLGLAQDSRFPLLQQELHDAIADGRVDLEVDPPGPELVEALTKVHDAKMPRFLGRHIGVALDEEDDVDDLVDVLVRELCPHP